MILIRYAIKRGDRLMEQPLISIIVPVYKVEKYLEKCIESILTQTYKNIEVILVDDGSPDNCPAICDRYAVKDNRIRVIHKKNGGLSDARNAGLAVAKGDFISFIDSDDFVSKDFCELLLEASIKEKADMAICNYLVVDEDGNLIQEKNLHLPIKDGCINSQEFIKGYCGKYGWYYVIACNKIYKKKLFENIKYPIGKQHEDAFVIHHLAKQCNRIACIKKGLYFYVQRKGSIMSHISIRNMDLGEALIDQYKFAKQNRNNILKNYAVRRLSFELEKWKTFCINDRNASQKYDKLRKQAYFLLYEKSAWEGYSISAKIYYKLGMVFPRFADKLQKLKHQ